MDSLQEKAEGPELGADILLGARDCPRDLRCEKMNTRPRRDAYFSFQNKKSRAAEKLAQGPPPRPSDQFPAARDFFLNRKIRVPTGTRIYFFKPEIPGTVSSPEKDVHSKFIFRRPCNTLYFIPSCLNRKFGNLHIYIGGYEVT